MESANKAEQLSVSVDDDPCLSKIFQEMRQVYRDLMNSISSMREEDHQMRGDFSTEEKRLDYCKEIIDLATKFRELVDMFERILTSKVDRIQLMSASHQ